ncbi:LacI family DNA-binding transcriptional regulator [Pseudovibrio sp. Tun.PSC04-5.I4]|uniref:LacI family DNA-binding transcriptional regulator n=1 Tax=Pseudovibrio sp. Tun.PSC04-5.I4 TaxID=1798213 RepID=UPI000881D773|nr:LacI family DNA-binding transcriptional regulator [Pseudovibrio sp. Tun.PSC04-5.I4]SDQ86678.1 LacI family transcriptional regulator, fructose operon transcriptional repressor [Pseudovibrio sp. Tun.PSC04-5.I4]
MAKKPDEIAKALGVSITTVRLVLGGKAEKYRISKATQARINEYVAEHGVKFDLTARSLKLKRTNTFGLIIPRLSNPFFAKLSEELEHRCRKQGYQLIISCSNSDEETEKTLVNGLVQRNVDGLFVVSSTVQSQQYLGKTISKPLVFLDRGYGQTKAPVITSSNFEGGKDLSTAISAYAEGEPVYFLIGGCQQPTIMERARGYAQVMPEGQKAGWIINSERNRTSDGEQMMLALWDKLGKAPQNLMVSSLPVLEGALAVLRGKLGHIPADMRLATFDENQMLDFLPNEIWSLKQNEAEWATAALQAMKETLEGETPSGKTIMTSLIHRSRDNSVKV